MTKDASAGNYEFWKRQLRRYYTTSNMNLAPIEDQRGHLEKCVDAHLGTALTGDKDINEDTRIWPAGPGCTVNCVHALDKLFLKSQPLADRRRAIFHFKQAIGQKMSELITDKENERFAAVPYPYMDTQMPYARNIYEYDTSLTEPRRRAHKYDVHC